MVCAGGVCLYRPIYNRKRKGKNKKNEKLCKKVLTSAGKHDIIIKLSGADRTLKTKIKKTSKKYLTIETERDIINKLSRESGE